MPIHAGPENSSIVIMLLLFGVNKNLSRVAGWMHALNTPDTGRSIADNSRHVASHAPPGNTTKEGGWNAKPSFLHE